MSAKRSLHSACSTKACFASLKSNSERARAGLGTEGGPEKAARCAAVLPCAGVSSSVADIKNTRTSVVVRVAQLHPQLVASEDDYTLSRRVSAPITPDLMHAAAERTMRRLSALATSRWLAVTPTSAFMLSDSGHVD